MIPIRTIIRRLPQWFEYWRHNGAGRMDFNEIHWLVVDVADDCVRSNVASDISTGTSDVLFSFTDLADLFRGNEQ